MDLPSVYPCPRCGRTVAHDGDNLVDVPTASLHRCTVQFHGGHITTWTRHSAQNLGQQCECICGAPVHVAADGSKQDLCGGPHYCGEHLLTGGCD